MESDSSQRPDEAELCGICRQHILEDTTAAVVPEPYIPYFPERWNGLLVLAEAQNLAGDKTGYQEWLRDLSVNERLRRLPRDADRVGVQPWDDGSLKIAVAATFGKDPNRTAVSNGVPWSLSGEGATNVNPSEDLIEKATQFWSEMLPHIGAGRIVVAGKVANGVIREALERSGMKTSVTHWRLPSSLAMSRVSGMFSPEDLLRRFSEVAAVKSANPGWFKGNETNKVFFACHCVSLGADGLRPSRPRAKDV